MTKTTSHPPVGPVNILMVSAVCRWQADSALEAAGTPVRQGIAVEE